MTSGLETLMIIPPQPLTFNMVKPETSKIAGTGLSGYRTFDAIIYYESGLEKFMIILLTPHSLGLNRSKFAGPNRPIRFSDFFNKVTLKFPVASCRTEKGFFTGFTIQF